MSIGITKLTDKVLIQTIKELHGSINILECYGTSDLLYFELVAHELERRGYVLTEQKSLNVNKKP